LASFENGYSDGVIECLDLFAEILHYRSPPRAFSVGHHKIIGALVKKENGEEMFGPMVLFSMMHNTLKLIDQQIGSFDREGIKFVQNVAAGKEKASAEGSDVFQYLKTTALKLVVS